MKIGDLISEIRNDIRALNIDDFIPPKYIFNKLKGYCSLFIKRDSDNRRLFKLNNLWTTITCLSLQKSSLIQCCDIDIPSCKSVMKSVLQLPELYSTIYGNLINVTSVDGSTVYLQSSPNQYKDLFNREYYNKKQKYFWIENNYLIIPDTEVEVVTVRGMFINGAEAKKLNNCEKQIASSNSNSNKNCTSILDEEFVCPDYLLAVVKQETLKDILNGFKRIIVDEVPNGNNSDKVQDRQSNTI
jgi:hypothetical protein